MEWLVASGWWPALSFEFRVEVSRSMMLIDMGG